MQTISTIAVSLATVAALAGCMKSEPVDRHAQVESAAQQLGARLHESAGIDWFRGDVDAAFTKARQESKPVLLYWGAQWCAPCNELKASVFPRPEFVEKTRQFVAVQLDGDEPGAQQWAESFAVRGYPTVLLLRADRSELGRQTGTGFNEYLRALDAALSKLAGTEPPVESIVAALRASTAPLPLAHCKRLAATPYQEIVTVTITNGATGEVSTRLPSLDLQAADLQAAIDRCPADARIELAQLMMMRVLVIYTREFKDAAPVTANAGIRMKAAVRGLLDMLGDYQLVKAVRDVVPLADQSVSNIAEQIGAANPAELHRLRERWTAAEDAELDARANDASLSVTDRLLALQDRLIRAKRREPLHRVPPALADEALRRVQAALAAPQSAAEHGSIVVAALPILELLGALERAQALVATEIETSATPYYYMSRMAHIEEELGHPDAALEWFERAYRRAKGPTTRFQWGVDYLAALVRLKPQDENAVRAATVEVLGELEGSKRIYGTTRSSLALLSRLLQNWSAAGGHAPVLASIRKRMRGVCDKIPSAEDEAGAACEAFLKPGA